MARIRTIKPELWSDEKLAECSRDARLLFIGLLNFSDDDGRMEYSPKRVKMQIFPGDIIDVAPLVGELAQAGIVRIYRVTDRDYLQVPNFKKHQRVDHPRPSIIPAPQQEDSEKARGPLAEPSVKIPVAIPEASLSNPGSLAPEGNGIEGNGIEEARAKSAAPESGAPLLLSPQETDWSAIQHSTPTEDQVEKLYKLYPLKVGKIDAKKAIRKAVVAVQHGDADHPAMALAESLDYLAERLQLYAQSVEGGEFIPHPSTWFTQGRFWDDPKTWRVERASSKKPNNNGFHSRDVADYTRGADFVYDNTAEK